MNFERVESFEIMRKVFVLMSDKRCMFRVDFK
jgi:hypothetical protein